MGTNWLLDDNAVRHRKLHGLVKRHLGALQVGLAEVHAIQVRAPKVSFAHLDDAKDRLAQDAISEIHLIQLAQREVSPL